MLFNMKSKPVINKTNSPELQQNLPPNSLSNDPPATQQPKQAPEPQRPDLFTKQWVQWLQKALAGNYVDENITITIENCVTMDNGDSFWWHTCLANGQINVQHGRAADNNLNKLTFKSDYDTSRSVALGQKSIQEAFLEGKIRMDGDIHKLLEASSALSALKIPAVPDDSEDC